MKKLFTPIVGMLFLGSTPLFSQTLDDGLQAFYKFEGNLLDETTNYHLQQTSGAVTYSTLQAGDQYANFDGSTKLNCPTIFDNTGFDEMAISIWIKTPNVNNTYQYAIQITLTGGVYLEPNTGKIIGFFDANSSGSAVSNTIIADDEWHHIVVQNNGQTTFMYVDGKLEASVSEPLEVPAVATSQINLGKDQAGNYAYIGSTNEVRIYDRMLTMCEILELYGQGMLPTAKFSFDNSLDDFSGNGNHLQSIAGSPSYVPFVLNGDDVIQLDGSNTISTVSGFDNSDFDRTSVSVWLKTNNITATNQVIVEGSNLGFGLFLQANIGKIIGYMDNTLAGGYVSSISVSDNNWHHIILKSDGNVTSMYIDGVLDGTMNENMFVGNGSSNNKIFIGHSSNGQNAYTGYLNELLIFDRALSDCEIDIISDSKSTLKISDEVSMVIPMVSYPNPNDGNFMIDLGDSYNNVQAVVMDMNGRVIQDVKFNQTQLLQMHIETVTAGIYYVKVASGNKQGVMKIIKQ